MPKEQSQVRDELEQLYAVAHRRFQETMSQEPPREVVLFDAFTGFNAECANPDWLDWVDDLTATAGMLYRLRLALNLGIQRHPAYDSSPSGPCTSYGVAGYSEADWSLAMEALEMVSKTAAELEHKRQPPFGDFS